MTYPWPDPVSVPWSVAVAVVGLALIWHALKKKKNEHKAEATNG